MGKDAERVAEYRRRAAEMFGHAAEASDPDAREFLLQIATGHHNMAKHIENQVLLRSLDLVKPKSRDRSDSPKQRAVAQIPEFENR